MGLSHSEGGEELRHGQRLDGGSAIAVDGELPWRDALSWHVSRTRREARSADSR